MGGVRVVIMVFLIGIIKISIKEKIIRIGVVVLLTNKVLRGYNYKIAITKQLIRIFLKNVLLILTIGLNPIPNIGRNKEFEYNEEPY